MFAPICSANSGRIIANEVALRWPHRDGEIAFNEFAAVAESSYLVCDAGSWVLDKACTSLAEYRWKHRDNVKTCMDISFMQLQQEDFVEHVTEVLCRYDIPKGTIEFEITDTGAVLKNRVCRDNIHKLHELGIRIALDRFGTGYCSLTDLRELPVWRIKLDRRFVESVHQVDGNRSMGRSIIAMAHSMDIETTVYRIETAEQAQWFRELGCDALQGAYFEALAVSPYSNVDAGMPEDRQFSVALDNQG